VVCCGVLPPEAISGLATVIQFLDVSIEDTSSWAHFLYTTRIGIDVKDYESAMEHLVSRLRTTQLGSKGWTIVRTRTPEDMQHSERTGYRADCWGLQDCAEGYARFIEHLSGNYDTLRRC